MFNRAYSFNSDLSKWDVQRCTDFAGMYYSAYSFVGEGLSRWNTSSAKTTYVMFYWAESFNSDISGWDVSRVTNFRSMFNDADSFSADLSSWNTSSGTTMRGMFYDADSFNSDISSWDVSTVTEFNDMFWGAKLFNQDLCAWGSKVDTNATFYFMFDQTNCTNKAFPDLSANPPGPFCFECV